MAVRKIRVNPDPVLRRKAKKVPELDASIERLIGDMVETLKAAPGVGLAAPQVGVSLRLIVVELPDKQGVLPIVNPEVVKRGGERVCEEGCLSIPGFKGEVTRCKWIKVKGLDSKGREIRIKGEDLLAQVLEHEIDHLNGVLYIDKLTGPDKLVAVEQETGNKSPESSPEPSSAPS